MRESPASAFMSATNRRSRHAFGSLASRGGLGHDEAPSGGERPGEALRPTLNPDSHFRARQVPEPDLAAGHHPLAAGCEASPSAATLRPLATAGSSPRWRDYPTHDQRRCVFGKHDSADLPNPLGVDQQHLRGAAVSVRHERTQSCEDD